jgi:hypothetical protein
VFKQIAQLDFLPMFAGPAISRLDRQQFDYRRYEISRRWIAKRHWFCAEGPASQRQLREIEFHGLLEEKL